MAPAAPTEPEENAYELLGLDAEIRTAYQHAFAQSSPRSRTSPVPSFTVLSSHTVRCRIDTKVLARTCFVHVQVWPMQLQSFLRSRWQLLDLLRRLALDAQFRLSAAKKAHFAAYDNKRKIRDDLEERERAFAFIGTRETKEGERGRSHKGGR